MTPNIVVILTKTTAPTAAAGTGDIPLIFGKKIDEQQSEFQRNHGNHLKKDICKLSLVNTPGKMVGKITD